MISFFTTCSCTPRTYLLVILFVGRTSTNAPSATSHDANDPSIGEAVALGNGLLSEYDRFESYLPDYTTVRATTDTTAAAAGTAAAAVRDSVEAEVVLIVTTARQMANPNAITATAHKRKRLPGSVSSNDHQSATAARMSHATVPNAACAAVGFVDRSGTVRV